MVKGFFNGFQAIITKTIAAVFWRGSKKSESNNDAITITARRKGDPQYYVEGIKPQKKTKYIVMFLGCIS